MLPEPSDRARHTPAVTPEARQMFLEALSAAYSVSEGARLAGVHRSSFYRLRAADEEFAEAWRDAWEAGADAIRDEVRRRAIEGWDEEVVSAGKVVTTIRRYDSRLLEMLAKSRDASFRDRPDMAVSVGIAFDSGPQKIKGGVSLSSVAKVLLDAGVDLVELAAGADRAELEAGEIVDVEDVPMVEGDE